MKKGGSGFINGNAAHDVGDLSQRDETINQKI